MKANTVSQYYENIIVLCDIAYISTNRTSELLKIFEAYLY